MAAGIDTEPTEPGFDRRRDRCAHDGLGAGAADRETGRAPEPIGQEELCCGGAEHVAGADDQDLEGWRPSGGRRADRASRLTRTHRHRPLPAPGRPGPSGHLCA
ncbi:hypothetical protein SDC9_181210 [bioreactor metagenome]|uniref:Uncharacterized protein n=1 Tax=bioreactor metagenome TaxID=1076179 RepID=A0A645H6M1_9ZZZZ